MVSIVKHKFYYSLLATCYSTKAVKKNKATTKDWKGTWCNQNRLSMTITATAINTEAVFFYGSESNQMKCGTERKSIVSLVNGIVNSFIFLNFSLYSIFFSLAIHCFVFNNCQQYRLAIELILVHNDYYVYRNAESANIQ